MVADTILFVLMVLILYFGLKSNSQAFKFVSSFAWFIPIGILTQNNITGLTHGSSLQVFAIVICLGLMIIQMVWSFRKSLQTTNSRRDKDGNVVSRTEEHEGWHLPVFMSSGESEEEQIRKAREQRRENKAEYRKRFHNAINGENNEDNK